MPSDLSTDIGNGEVNLIVWSLRSTEEPPAEVLSAIASSVSVETEDGGGVAVEVTVIPHAWLERPQFQSAEEIARLQAHISIEPMTSWSDVWHTITYRLPKYAGVRGEGDAPADRIALTRFRPTPEFLVQRIELCDYGDGKGTTIDLWLSQPPIEAEKIVSNLAFTADGTRCPLEAPSDSTDSVRDIRMHCAASGYTDFELALLTQVSGTNGESLHTLDGDTTFAVSSRAPEWRAGPSRECKVWMK